MPLLVAVHAHPDDETLSTGGLLATWARSAPVEVVTCTRGERGEVIGAALAHLEGDGPALAAHREAELARAVTALGVERHAFLDELAADDVRLEDSGMVWVADGVAGPAPDAPPGAFARADVDDVAAVLAAHLAAARPAVVVTYGPDGGYGHPDHVRAHQVTMRAVARLAELGPVPIVLWSRPRVAAGPHVAVPLGPVVGEVAQAMRAHATQVQDVVVGPEVIDFALSNAVPQRLGPVELYEPAPGTATPFAWPAGVVATGWPVR